MVCSVLEFGLLIWRPGLKYLVGKLKRIQERFLRYMYLKAFEYYPIDISYGELLEGFNIQSWTERYKVTLLFLHDLLTGKISNCRLIAAVNLRVPRRSSISHMRHSGLNPHAQTYSGLSLLRRAAKLYNIIIVKDPKIDIFSMGQNKFRTICYLVYKTTHMWLRVNG